MKKVAIILLISIYAVSTLGIGLKQFYCCGKLKTTTVSLGNVATKCNSGEDKDNCCKTKFQFYKIKDTHFANDILNIPVKHYTELYKFTSLSELQFTAPKQPVITNSLHAPPLYSGVPVHISNCVSEFDLFPFYRFRRYIN